MNRFFVDAETDGLYGAFLSAAVLVVNEQGEELDRFYGAVDAENADIRSEWVKENVVPYLRQAERVYPDENALLTAFWDFWMRWRENVLCIADVGVPVEARLFTRCVAMDAEAREFLGPYPLLDLSTALYAKGLDPLAERRTLSGLELPQHDPMNDVRMASAIWDRLFREAC